MDVIITENSLRHTYYLAKSIICNKGYSHEICLQSKIDFNSVSEQTFLKEAAWVILSSGMKESIVRKKFIGVSKSFYHWESARRIKVWNKKCYDNAMRYFGHSGKINAIIEVAEIIAEEGFSRIKSDIQEEGVSYLLRFPFIGRTTSYHLAKNIGIDVAKPDRHLVRLAEAMSFSNAFKLCSHISTITGDSCSVVDLVLWRFAAISPNYLDFFKCKE